MSTRLTAIVTIEVPASQRAAEIAQKWHDKSEGFEKEKFVHSPEWLASEKAAMPSAVSKMTNSMKGWKRSNTDVLINWCGLRGWCHQFQTYWEQG